MIAKSFHLLFQSHEIGPPDPESFLYVDQIYCTKTRIPIFQT